MNHHPHLLQQPQQQPLLQEPPPLQQPPPPPLPLLHQQHQQLPLPPSRFTICKRHPEEPLTGFCASCLRERLVGLDSSISTISHPKTSTTAATFKSIFRGGPSSVITDSNKDLCASTSSSSNLPELRRCKSFSGRKAEGLSIGFEPQRKSCDVRGGVPTLFNLINREEDTTNLGVCEEIRENSEEIRGNREEIRANQVIEEVEIEAEEEEEEEVLTMKDHLEQESQNKKQHSSKDLKEIAGNFWSAASVFTKKLQKWKKKQKPKKSETSTNSGLSSTNTNRHHNNKTHTELADYGRRSCDIDPRFSLDIGRISFDGPRYSLDEPRASWDGYLIGKTFPRLAPMVSVVEDVPIPVVKRSDNQIPVEDTSTFDTTPGGTAQTRDYYSSSDSSQRRRKSFDQSSSDLSQRRRKSFERSNSIRKKAAAVGAELDESKLVTNSILSPTNVEFHGAKLIGTDRDLRDSRANSLRNDDRSETQSHESVLRDFVSCSVDQKESKKSSSRWSKAWNIWGIMNKKNPSSSKDDDDDEERSNNRANVVERSFSESWQELRKDTNANGESKGGINRVLRSNSSVSSRNATNSSGAFGGGGVSSSGGAFGNVSSGGVRNVVETNGIGKKKKEEVVLERTKSARYSSSDVIDNGLLRFYLTPLRNSKRSASGNGRPKNNAQSIAKRVLGLY
ncbi:hypothetical protein MKW92_019002 [Papaver armeniacum]|nr:hypothetical protein MKW92_019002 [Papaver armeniacum]